MTTVSDEQPRWPLWSPLAALGIGLAGGLILAGMLFGIAQAADKGLNTDSPWFTSLSSFSVDVCVVVASIGMAGVTARVRPWQFGLRRAPLGFTAGMATIAFGCFLVFEIVYAAILHPKNPQTIVQDLGANQSTLLLVVGAIVVIVVAPFCEEFFFRGFVFRVLRMRMGFWAAAALDGVIFGAAHGALVILPVLAVLGVALCWVYERTGSILPTMALHALNNTIAYGGSTHDGWVAAGAVGGAMIGACAIALVVLPRRVQGVTAYPSNG
jgi:membrane protease YdiL (CAAX protease family)